MAKYTHGKTFQKDGKSVRYRYTDKDPKTKKLVAVKNTKTKSKR